MFEIAVIIFKILFTLAMFGIAAVILFNVAVVALYALFCLIAGIFSALRCVIAPIISAINNSIPKITAKTAATDTPSLPQMTVNEPLETAGRRLVCDYLDVRPEGAMIDKIVADCDLSYAQVQRILNEPRFPQLFRYDNAGRWRIIGR